MTPVSRRTRSYERVMALFLMLALAAPSFAFLVSTDAGASPTVVTGVGTPAAIVSSLGASYHAATASEIERMMQEVGVRSEGYVPSATGLAPPSEESWRSLEGKLLMLDSLPSVPLAPSLDLSTNPCFPKVGNQLNQGSCAAWAATYYCYGFLEAKDNGWTDASSGNTAHLMSPAWTYNKVNDGGDYGSWMTENMQVICDWGAATLATMPYNDADDLGWGSAAAFREAPLHRALATVAMNCNGTDWTISQIKTVLNLGTTVAIAIDHSSVFHVGLLDNDIFSSAECTGTNMDHAQTIVGYDDTISEDGDVGAFRVVNSWGSSGSEGTDHGYYWFTYAALKKLMTMVGMEVGMCYIEDRVDYAPSLIGVWHFDTGMGRNGDITVGVGTGSGGQERSLYYAYDSAHRMPTFMCADMTDFESQYASGETSLHLRLGSSTLKGSLSSFRVERYAGGYLPGGASQISPQTSALPAQNPVAASVVLPLDATVAYDAALDTTSRFYSSSSVSRWVGIDHLSYHDGDAIESGDTADSGESSLTIDLTGPATYGVDWRVSSQAGKDYLRLSIDGTTVASISGVVDWKQEAFSLSSGHHLAKFTYAKDGSISVGEDAGYIDHLRQLATDDAFEENDAQSYAAAITPGEYPALVYNDEDWYSVSVAQDNSIYANISFGNAAGNLDLFLYGPDMATLLDSSQTSSNTESVVAGSVDAGTYYIAVKAGVEVSNAYDLDVGTSSGPPPVVHPLSTVLDVTGDLGLNDWFVSTVTVGLTAMNGHGDTTTYFSVNGAPWQTYATPFSLATEGVNQLSYYSVDAAMNVEGERNAMIKVDTSAPTIDVTVSATLGEGGWFLSMATLGANASDLVSGVASFTCAVDSGATVDCSGSFLVGGDGEHTVVLSAVDAAGNPSTCPALSIKIDTTAPEVVALLDGITGEGGWFTTAVGASLDVFDNGSGPGTWYIGIDGGPFSSTSVVVTEAGEHTLRYYACDVAGNPSEVNETTFRIDDSPPQTGLAIEGDAGSDGWYASAVNITLNAADDQSGVHDTLVSLDGEPYHACPSELMIEAPGAHTLRYYSVDGAGNAEEERSFSFGVDTVAPVSDAVLTGAEGSAGWYKGAVTVSIQSADVTSGVDVARYRIDGGMWQDFISNLTVGTSGEHVFEYLTIDRAGNREEVRSIVFRIDMDAPHTHADLAGETGTNGWYVGTVSVSLVATDDGTVEALWQRLDGGAWGIYPTAGISISQDGRHTIEFYAIDAANNTESAVTVDILIDSVSPVPLPPSVSTSHSTGGSLTILWSSSDALSGLHNTTVYVDGIVRSTSTGAGGTVTAAGLADGTHNITVVSIDAAGNRAASFASVTVDTNPLSPSGPYGPWIDVGILVALGAIVAAFFVLRRRAR